MGSGSSKQSKEILSVYPVYYIPNAQLTPEDAGLVPLSWKLIYEDKGLAWAKMKETAGENAPSSCLAWMYDTFYERLFDVHPSSKDLFRGNMQAQGKALVQMLNGKIHNHTLI